MTDDFTLKRDPPSLRNTLGLQTHRHASYIGATSEFDGALLDLNFYDDIRNESQADNGSFRKVRYGEFFHQFEDVESPNHVQEIKDLDRIEGVVAPHGRSLIDLYFRIIHPNFPILHRLGFLEKYARNYREFSPPLLAAVYILAINWRSHNADLPSYTRAEIAELESIAFRSLQDVSQRPKLSTLQAGLLLLQRSSSGASWQLTAQLVAIGQDIGLHLDCSDWRIPIWERGLRKRIAWALFMQDTWSAVIYGRPPHIAPSNWAVQLVEEDEYLDSPNEHQDPDRLLELRKGRRLFGEMTILTRMLSTVLERLYSQKADIEIQQSLDPTKAILERAKPIQLQLRSWYTDMPDTLKMDITSPGTLSSVGYLHLAYYATEITLHRRIIRSLSSNTPSNLVHICRSAAKARLISAMDFFNRLKKEHLQSFWYFASKFNFALIGTFAGLCFVTSTSTEEAEFYQRRLQEYRWTLKVSNKSAEFLEISSGILESAVGSLLKVADSIDSRGQSFPMSQSPDDSDDGDENLASTDNETYDVSMET